MPSKHIAAASPDGEVDVNSLQAKSYSRIYEYIYTFFLCVNFVKSLQSRKFRVPIKHDLPEITVQIHLTPVYSNQSVSSLVNLLNESKLHKHSATLDLKYRNHVFDTLLSF